MTKIIVGLRVICVIGLPAWSWGRRLLGAPFNVTRMGNTSVRKRVALSVVRHAGDMGIASGRYSIGPGYSIGRYYCVLLYRAIFLIKGGSPLFIFVGCWNDTGIPVSKRWRVAKPEGAE